LAQKAGDAVDISILSREDLQKLVHELQVHQIELEMQNEELHMTQVGLEESRSKYQDLYDFPPVGYMTLNERGIILEANLTAVSLLSDEKQNLTKTSFSRFVTREFGDTFHMHLQEVFETYSKRTCEIKLAKDDGTQLYVQLDSVAVQDYRGQFNQCRTIILDITERKKAEAALQKSEAKYRFLAEHASDLLWTVDLNLNTTFVSPSIEKVLGFTPEERMLQDVEDQLTPECLEFVRQRLLEELKTERERGIDEGKSVLVDLDYRHKDGSNVCLQSAVSFIRDERGIPIGLHGISRDVTKFKRSQEALRKSEEKYRRVVENSHDVIYQADMDGHLIFASASSVEVFGYTMEEMLGRKISEFYVVPEDRTVFFKQIMEKGFVTDFEAQLVRKDGTRFWASTNAKLVTDEKGNLVGVEGVLRDVTVKKDAEEALRESEEEHRWLLESMINAFVLFDSVFDKNGKFVSYRFVYINKAFEQITGVRNEEVRGKTVHEVWPETEPSWIENYGEVAITGRSKEFEMYHEPTEKLYHCNVYRPWDSPGRFCVVFEDITERDRAERELQRNEATLRAILQAAPIGIGLVFEGRKLGWINEKLTEITGRQPAEVNGKSARLFYENESEFQRVEEIKMPQISATGTGSLETRFIHADGSLRDILLTSHVVDPCDRSKGLVFTAVDITDRKIAEREKEALERQLRESQKMEAVGTLTSGIAHDFNNLLTIMNGYTEMILLETTKDDPLCADLRKILETGLKGADLVKRLLALCKKGESNRQPLDMNSVLENSVRIIQRTFPKTIDIETVFEKDLGMVNADSAQLEQVLMNLCINAKEAMPDGGQLRIETRNTFVDEDYFLLHPVFKLGPHVLLEISDTGTGMSKETMDRIFDPFFTTRGWDSNKGTGLGLSVTKGIVEQHGGWITCESELGKGTTFTSYFPSIEDLPVDRKPEFPVGSVPQGEKILLVDDEDLVRYLGKRILERSGYAVITASNGKEALEIYAREQSNVVLIVLDLIMPLMDGEKCLKELLRMNPKVKVVVSTGHSLGERYRVSLGGRAKGFVNKPYQMSQFLEVVKKALVAK
jgi:two-component system cell cycle sensor histidine kinase/response regulator CckA